MDAKLIDNIILAGDGILCAPFEAQVVSTYPSESRSFSFWSPFPAQTTHFGSFECTKSAFYTTFFENAQRNPRRCCTWLWRWSFCWCILCIKKSFVCTRFAANLWLYVYSWGRRIVNANISFECWMWMVEFPEDLRLIKNQQRVHLWVKTFEWFYDFLLFSDRYIEGFSIMLWRNRYFNVPRFL